MSSKKTSRSQRTFGHTCVLFSYVSLPLPIFFLPFISSRFYACVVLPPPPATVPLLPLRPSSRSPSGDHNKFSLLISYPLFYSHTPTDIKKIRFTRNIETPERTNKTCIHVKKKTALDDVLSFTKTTNRRKHERKYYAYVSSLDVFMCKLKPL